MSRREVINQFSQYNRKDIDRFHQTVLSLGYWQAKHQLLGNTKKIPGKINREDSQRQPDNDKKKRTEQEMK